MVAGRPASRAYHGESHVVLILDIKCHDSASCNSWFAKGAHMPFWTQSTAKAFERAMNWVRITILSCNPDSQVEWGCVNTHHADCSILYLWDIVGPSEWILINIHFPAMHCEHRDARVFTSDTHRRVLEAVSR